MTRIATDMADSLERRRPELKGRRLSSTWFRFFKGRWPSLFRTAPTRQKKDRARGASKGKALPKDYFAELERNMEKNQENRPQDEHGVDATKLRAERKHPKVAIGAADSTTKPMTPHEMGTADTPPKHPYSPLHDANHRVRPAGDAEKPQPSHNHGGRHVAPGTSRYPRPQEEKREDTNRYRASEVCMTEDRILLKFVRADEHRVEADEEAGREVKEAAARTSQPWSSGTSPESTSRRLFNPQADDSEDDGSTEDDDGDEYDDEEDDITDGEDEDEEDTPCCVCGRDTPPHPQDDPETFSWVACDANGCTHWVHQQFCTPTKQTYGTSDVYRCPCH